MKFLKKLLKKKKLLIIIAVIIILGLIGYNFLLRMEKQNILQKHPL